MKRRPPLTLLFCVLAALCSLCLCGESPAADWVHWRGPEENGVSRETGLPETFELTTPGQGGLIWKQPYGGRSAPLVLGGRVYMIGGHDPGKEAEGERVMCFDAQTGKPIWEQRFGVWLTDIVSSRLGWTTLTADPATGHVYCHSTAGLVICFDKDGHKQWEHSLTEEFGRISGYGGRIASPIFDSGLVIVGMANSSWGDMARGAARFIAFDGKTGQVAWISETPFPLKGTYASNPVITVINGQRLLISGAADGYGHAFKVRTGERVWSFRVSGGVVNPAPVVDGNLVYFAHGDVNPHGGSSGRVVCVDASQVAVNPQTKQPEPKVVWDHQDLGRRFGLSSPAVFEGRLYMPDDGADLYCFDGKSGKVLWRVNYGSTARGAPLIGDGKLYIFEVNARMTIFKLNGNRPPEELDKIAVRRTAGVGLVETNGTPIAVNGRLYFLTADGLYCVGEEAKGQAGKYKPLAAETSFDENAAPAAVELFPAEVLAKPGEQVKFTLRFVDANGREVKAPAGAQVQWSLPQPPLPKTAPAGATPPPPLNGELKAEGAAATVALGKLPRQQGYVLAKAGPLTARGRVRVAAQVPYTEDFEKTPAGAAPSGWLNAQGKWFVVDKGGNKVLSKMNTDSRPSFSRGNAFITAPTASNYTIEADMLGTEVHGKMPDLGLLNCRYHLILEGKPNDTGKRQARIITWDARERVSKEAPFEWEPNVWYHAKLSVQVEGKKGLIRAKVWKNGAPEPAEWTLTLEDPNPNTEGAAALYAYISDASITAQNPGSEALFDNVAITPNQKK